MKLPIESIILKFHQAESTMEQPNDDDGGDYTVSLRDDLTPSGYPLTYIQEDHLTNNDVLCGSGNHTNRWPGKKLQICILTVAFMRRGSK